MPGQDAHNTQVHMLFQAESPDMFQHCELQRARQGAKSTLTGAAVGIKSNTGTSPEIMEVGSTLFSRICQKSLCKLLLVVGHVKVRTLLRRNPSHAFIFPHNLEQHAACLTVCLAHSI